MCACVHVCYNKTTIMIDNDDYNNNNNVINERGHFVGWIMFFVHFTAVSLYIYIVDGVDLRIENYVPVSVCIWSLHRMQTPAASTIYILFAVCCVDYYKTRSCRLWLSFLKFNPISG